VLQLWWFRPLGRRKHGFHDSSNSSAILNSGRIATRYHICGISLESRLLSAHITSYQDHFLIPQLSQRSIRPTTVVMVETMMCCPKIGVWMRRAMWVSKVVRRIERNGRRSCRSRKRVAILRIGSSTQRMLEIVACSPPSKQIEQGHMLQK